MTNYKKEFLFAILGMIAVAIGTAGTAHMLKPILDDIFWHQLIAPGYGLVDNRDGKIRKTEAFYAFKKMINQ